jgi:hypothetical protein
MGNTPAPHGGKGPPRVPPCPPTFRRGFLPQSARTPAPTDSTVPTGLHPKARGYADRLRCPNGTPSQSPGLRRPASMSRRDSIPKPGVAPTGFHVPTGLRNKARGCADAGGATPGKLPAIGYRKAVVSGEVARGQRGPNLRKAFGVGNASDRSRGSSLELATPGFVTESRWDKEHFRTAGNRRGSRPAHPGNQLHAKFKIFPTPPRTSL